MISLCILDQCSEKLLSCKDDGEAMTVLGAYLEKVSNRDSTLPTVPHASAMSNYSPPDGKVGSISFISLLKNGKIYVTVFSLLCPIRFFPQ